MKKVIKIPSEFIRTDSIKNSLVFDGGSIMQEVLVGTDQDCRIFLEEQTLFFVLEGSVTFSYGPENFAVDKNEMTLLKNGMILQCNKSVDPNNGCYRGLLFCLKDELIRTFLIDAEKMKAKSENGELRSGVYAMNDCLHTFIQSLDPYFKHNSEVNLGQFRLKINEMLYHLGIGNKSLFDQLIQSRSLIQGDIQQVVEKYYTSAISLENLAHLSGRSLSSFKRDFKRIYNVAPAVWIRQRRLTKARELLESTGVSLSEICFAIGFENVSHFSRIFKQHYGNSPTSYRN